jgi:hypothetical protein
MHLKIGERTPRRRIHQGAYFLVYLGQASEEVYQITFWRHIDQGVKHSGVLTPWCILQVQVDFLVYFASDGF